MVQISLKAAAAWAAGVRYDSVTGVTHMGQRLSDMQEACRCPLIADRTAYIGMVVGPSRKMSSEVKHHTP